MQIQKIILINPSMRELYKGSKVEGSVGHYPPLNLLTIAGGLLEYGHEVKILDLDLEENIYNAIEKAVKDFNPDIVGITFASALYTQCMNTISAIRKIKANTIIVAGGAHASSDPKSTLENTDIDIAVMGEGDYTIPEIIKNELKDVKGIAYKNEKKEVIINLPRQQIQDLDKTPLPAFELIDANKYYVPLSYCKKNPCAPFETSRGCIYGCVYCNKSVFGKNFRAKSPERILKEIKNLIDLGYRDLHIIDDMFTTDPLRVKEICKSMKEQNIKIHWSCPNGIRVNSVEEEMLTYMKEAGCYRVSFGIESGSQKVLNEIKKGQTLDQVRNAVKLCRKAKIETTGFFMFGLPGDTEETMQQTIDFAKELDLDIAKFNIMTPLPSTPIYEKWKGTYIKFAEAWDKFQFHKSNDEVYNHPTLSWEQINKYYNKSYKEYYLRPKYLVRRIWKSIIYGTVITDAKIFLKVKW